MVVKNIRCVSKRIGQNGCLITDEADALATESIELFI
jgi:hypothetical protein